MPLLICNFIARNMAGGKLSSVLEEMVRAILGPWGLFDKLLQRYEKRRRRNEEERKRNFRLPEDLRGELRQYISTKWGFSMGRLGDDVYIVDDLHVPPGEVYTTIEYIQQLYYAELEMNRVDDETTIGELLDFMEENIFSQHA